MQYQIKMTTHASNQIKENKDYISKVLDSANTAMIWSQKIRKSIHALSEFPYRYPLLTGEPWHTGGIRKMKVDQFIVYYFTDDVRYIVGILAVVNSRQDQITALKKIPHP